MNSCKLIRDGVPVSMCIKGRRGQFIDQSRGFYTTL